MSILPEDCPDCDNPGNGECARCHGTGYEPGVINQIASSLAGEDGEDCSECGGSGDCPSCDGDGVAT